MPGNNNRKPFLERMMNAFFQGLLILIPLYLTVYVVYLLIRTVYRFLSFAQRLVPLFPESWQAFRYTDPILTVVTFVVVFLLIVLIGVLAKTLFGKGFLRTIEGVIKGLPGINSLYLSLKQLVRTIFPKNKEQSFMGVVLVRYPHPGSWSIAFQTGEAPESISPDKRKDFIAVFMPSTPNPTTGFVMIVPKSDVKYLKISIEDAFKIIMSGGLVMENKTEDEDEI